MALSTTDQLAALQRHTRRLEATADSLEDVSGPSLCPGWTRGHVLAHLARNAEALARVARAAVEGTGEAMYPSDEARDAEVEEGAHRDARTQAADLRASDQIVARALAALGPEHAEYRLERTPGGRLVPAGRLPFMRLREVVLHHLDLDAGFGLADVEPDLVEDLLLEEVTRLRACDPPPDVTIRTTEGEQWSVGLGSVEVTGDRVGVLGWLARGVTEGVSGSPLPRLPEGR
ncbi:maleylpyruvate isomerase family mycothiol-dependent enzyme [Phycicoccus endophyticus]|uniref:Maleylpyruvate isomerase family mycothiol-dependent enzyme n=1 Tax=Phycicoccus endophyticus TaxID=1690220 RepID=A0A7G9R4C8_9MICO|nr:maleylpyruvate isomerase family mycothiol-dependent enzyme [Phycicoccus endophyticus]NHI18322.1 maleylpyruvate isomerase family mycothiol-dependent enzyme [Phycicoccus endophyticus]QNN50453.1 maleylpyruvate isomerase family mycothiol-dependent enzyme [Phycicoccus endophyticus]GGL24672.1 maleylpyruvate isomerase [Phycicoccus endophyticus]